MRRMGMKAVAVSSGLASVAMMVKWSVPVVVEFVRVLWSWVVQPQPQPPCIYLLINCIILSIVASSKLRLHPHPHPHPHPHMGMDSPPLAEDSVVSSSTWTPPNIRDDHAPAEEEKDNQTVDDDDEFLVSGSTREEHSNSNSKPPVSARFAHRKPAKPALQAGKRVLRVSRPQRQETLDSTWRTITEGRPMPLKRHLKKSDTFSFAGYASPVRVLKKSETFAGGSSSPESGGSSSGGRLRREPSLSQDELNRRVEAFISKFNEEMRLQRQESLNHYREMVGRGVGAH